jgi:hypothetical protein
LPKRLLSFLSFFRYREPHASLLQLPRVEPRAHRGLETHKGRDDPTAQAVFQEIRNIAINLANDLSTLLKPFSTCDHMRTDHEKNASDHKNYATSSNVHKAPF